MFEVIYQSGLLNKGWRAVVVTVALGLSARSAAAKTVAVGSCNPSLVAFTTIQAAVDGVPDGSTVQICPGTYPEQVSISASVTLVGVQSGNSGLPVIVPPAGGLVHNVTALNVSSGFLQNTFIAAQILVNAGVNVTIRNIALDGSNNGIANCAGLVPVGIYFRDASGNVNHIAAKNQLAACNGSPNGDGVFVQSDGLEPTVVTIQNSSFHNDGWMAVHADGAGAGVTIKNNTAVGPGNTGGNGILIEFGATGSVVGNVESNALATAESTGFWGVLLNCVDGGLVNNNTISNTQIGVYATTCGTQGNTITNNQVFDSQLDGIVVCGSGNTVQGNSVNDSGRAGVNLLQGCSSQNNLVSNNTINGACAAVLAGTDAVTNTIGPNTVFNSKSLQLTGSSCP